ncbi:uncharacterized protein C8Q71DRAFT_749083 [Rhodofomes roseus]|uniref:RING-type domain-containing protein n=1 Tax=Rhodofomes roseus TaxID=34475 RepID=A0ABQ8KM06_9APHY|nr:uncharacterized protein C8Q71DRAFT_749083 [Rhodofomes roseus]KAH9839359.1 hypothetical protein C8Q71DRAFT_749083 [Rhodofomes roseus]
MPLPTPAPPAYSPEDCAICFESLHVAPRDEEGSSYMIDDVELYCNNGRPNNHHFHWSCITDYVKSGGDRAKCPLCRGHALDARGRMIVGVTNEGGVQGGVDLGDIIDEEIFEESQPESWRLEQAFLGLMAQCDYAEAEELLRDRGVDVNCTYPTGGQTALHMAAMNDDVEGVELLLRYGADKAQLDEAGWDALRAAREVAAKEVPRLLA